MMKAIVKFHENCIRVISDSARQERKISMGYIEQTMGNDVLYQLNQMKFKRPDLPEHEMRKYFDDLHDQIDTRFRDLAFN
jgi:vacuolar-type H+-ATPase catalytic subunit A/Vma1